MEGTSFANTTMASGKVADIHTELQNKERNIESLKTELGKAKELEVKLAGKEASFRKLKQELIKLKSFECKAMDLLSQGRNRIHELEEEIDKRKESEKKIYHSFVAQSKEYKQTQISLEESKQEIKFLLENLEKSKGSSEVASSQSSTGDVDHFASLESELQQTEDNLARALETEKVSSLKAKRLAEEVNSLKSELESTIEAEENNKKAMDDLAMALQEVKAEAEQTKEMLILKIHEVEKTKAEVQNLKLQLRNIEEKYIESMKESDTFKNTSERLRLEAEETLLAWNEKEKGFVDCIREAEDAKNIAEEESKALLISLREAENMNKKAKEENQKLRDIMRQAINEANVAKEAASIAREENYQLKDLIAKKDEANWETEKQKPVSSADKEHSKKPKHNKRSSKIPVRKNENDAGSEYSDDPLKGSIFDVVVSPKAASSTSSASHQRKTSSSVFTDDEAMNGEEFENIESVNFDEESDRSSRKKKALLRRFSDLIRRKSFQKKEQTLE